ncbi:hypothetical protein DKX38_023888 [Salix brachista]|uniref:TRAF-type domain-containing protein n=1 Tax=Salix brachista TaxID=2182728 RepID=A0A5N5JJY4_9ROSI|nr:hypothetical protein DKX38_023888 [Salix brachista]
MKITATIKNCVVIVLLDSGSSHNFIHVGMVKRLGWKLDPTYNCDVMIADGGQVQCKGSCAAVPLTIDSYSYTSDMFALQLGGCDIVLGVQLLRTLGPVLWDFEALTMKFWCGREQICLSSARPQSPHPISCQQMDKLLLSGCCGVLLCAIEGGSLAIPASTLTDKLSSTQQQELQALLDSFAAIFGTPTSLPPVRDFDHQIPLIAGCKPPSIRPYAYSSFQKSEIEKCIKELMEAGLGIWWPRDRRHNEGDSWINSKKQQVLAVNDPTQQLPSQSLSAANHLTKFHIDNGLLKYNSRIVLSPGSVWIAKVFTAHHSVPTAGHAGFLKTYQRSLKHHFWKRNPGEIISMDLPTSDLELVRENEKIEDDRERGLTFHCELYDTEIVRKLAQAFLPGLSTACVNNTTGDMFRNPGSVAADIRKEMVDYLTQRSERFVAESVVLEGDLVSDHPYDIISNMVDDFASLKLNLFSRVSGWLLSEKREDKIDDFVQEMEISGFWLLDRREAVAQILVKNVGLKNIFHCDKKFNTAEELAEHVVNCGFRTMNCTNEGCSIVFCASHLEKHDSTCPFKIIPCEQQCSENVMRREMDRHCITVCRMKSVSCPLYAVGCQSTMPHFRIQQHCSDNLLSHLLYTLKTIHKGGSEEDLNKRVDQIVELLFYFLNACLQAKPCPFGLVNGLEDMDRGEIISMDLPTSDLELVRENEKIEDDRERGLTFHCELYDTEIVRKLAQAFLPGLSTACVNNTTGDMFRNPGSVAADIRKEMVDYLTQRSERFVAESVVLEGDLVSDHPYDIISNMVDDFASLKLNLFSRVSGWLLSEKREDKIDDFVQEMEISGFWLLDRREAVAQILVKNVGLKNIFHCDKKFNTAEELAEHVVNCGFRTMNCTNEGCSIVFCASHLEKHDSTCPFKIIPCEQQCSENVMRREMDRHCITVCRMKSVSCPLYAVGCQSTMPHFRIQQHCSDNLLSHLLYTLKTIHKGGSEEDLNKRVDQIVELLFYFLNACLQAKPCPFGLVNGLEDMDRGEIISMNLPTSDLELVRENEKIEDDRERGLTFHCELYDTEIVRKLAQAFLPGLSTACVNNTTGDMFRNPGSVAADIRKEMVDYLTQRSERFVAESVVLEGDLVSDHPYDIISNMVDDFASLKLNLFSRVSGWLLSEKREDKIDDFVQEMEISGFWLLDRREAVAQILVKNVGLKNIFHCDKKFNTAEELAEHVVNCGFRTMNCTNEGCSIVFCASHLEKHDSTCPFKIIPCEQQCSENVMRREMDRHCITVCRMKSVSCPLYAVGCQSTMPHFRIQQHCSDNLLSHLLYTLKTIHKGGSEEDLNKRVDQIVELLFYFLNACLQAKPCPFGLVNGLEDMDRGEIISMDLPTSDLELVRENEKIEDDRERGLTFHCELYDTEIVRKLAQAFLPGLSTACVNNTTGDMFRNPGSVAADIRKEMVDYLTQRSERFVAESVVLEGDLVSDHPYDIISNMVDDFASLKLNLFSRVSGWLLSEKREDKIDDFVQEMEISGFWLLDRREAVAQILVKNVGLKNIFHCDKKFNTAEELAEHVVNCGFRTMNCTNEGCSIVFCASHLEKHDSTCPFKIIPCEQQCSENVMRREMDRHCITVCRMKSVSCPLYAVGCQSTMPHFRIQQHCSDNLLSHLLYTLKTIHKGGSEEDLNKRVDQIVELLFYFLNACLQAKPCPFGLVNGLEDMDRGEIISMDLPTSDLELVRENEKIEDDRERGLTFHCELYDTEIVRKLAQAFLPGLSTACVNNTTGDMFRNPGSVAADIRKEMVDYLTQRSERFVAESVVLEGDLVSDHPYDIISNMVDDFASLKLNLFSRVSGWLLSDKREDKIDDFVQEMEISGLGLLDRREAVAQILVKNVGLKNIFHCDKKFNTAEELAEHVVNCGFRTMNCTNEGCSIVFCASHLEKHDSACPFKIIPCEQQCSENVMRREMDRHCITVCRMKSVSCPLYAVGCQSTMPHFRIQQYCSDNLLSHLLYTLKTIHKGGSEEDLNKRVDQIVEGRMADAVIFQAALVDGFFVCCWDARSLILKVKDVEAKLGPLEVKVSEKVSEEPNKAGENSTEESIEAFNKGGEQSSEEDKIGGEKSTETINKVGEELSSIQV